MKFVIILACLVAAIMAQGDDHHAHIIKYENDIGHDSYHYSFETDNHIRAEQEGQFGGKDEHDWVVKGEYEYKDPHGQETKVDYIADQHGYHPHVHFA